MDKPVEIEKSYFRILREAKRNSEEVGMEIELYSREENQTGGSDQYRGRLGEGRKHGKYMGGLNARIKEILGGGKRSPNGGKFRKIKKPLCLQKGELAKTT